MAAEAGVPNLAADKITSLEKIAKGHGSKPEKIDAKAEHSAFNKGDLIFEKIDSETEHSTANSED